jgi:hypothetical protein
VQRDGTVLDGYLQLRLSDFSRHLAFDQDLRMFRDAQIDISHRQLAGKLIGR